VTAIRTVAWRGAFDAGAERDLEVAEAVLLRAFPPNIAAFIGLQRYGDLAEIAEMISHGLRPVLY